MKVTITLDLSDLISAIAAIHVYAGELAEYGSSAESAEFLALSERIQIEITRVTNAG